MRTALLYLVMVGLPVLGVLAVLRAGERLSAPPHVGGAWQVDTSDGCAMRPGGVLTLVQSGEHLVATWPGGGEARASLRGRRLVVAPAGRGRVVPGCSGSPVELVATVTDARPERLRGVARPPGCADCPARAWEAVRVDPPVPSRADAH